MTRHSSSVSAVLAVYLGGQCLQGSAMCSRNRGKTYTQPSSYGRQDRNMQQPCALICIDALQGPALELSYWHGGGFVSLTEGFLKCTILAMARSGRRTGA